MPLPFIDVGVSGPKGRQTVELIVDSGMTYSVLPRHLWRRLGVRRKRNEVFTLGDRTHLERDIGEGTFSLGGWRRRIEVVLGKPNDMGILGTAALSKFGVVYNPYERTLRLKRTAA
jgi:predicted aspartyl protease